MNGVVVYLLAIAQGLWMGWFMWRRPRLKYLRPTDLVFRLRIRASVRRVMIRQKMLQSDHADKIADLLEEAANEIEKLKE